MEESRKRKSPVNEIQKKLLTEFLHKYPILNNGKFSSEFTHKKAQNLWEEITVILNNVANGPKKEWKEWRKTWQDIKKKKKAKVAFNKKSANITGGGPNVLQALTETENNILDFIAPTVISGLPETEEQEVVFDFNMEQENITPSQRTESVLPEVTSIDHNYNFTLPQVSGPPKKRFTQTRRLESSLKVSQQAVKGNERRTEILESYYETKKKYIDHKMKYDELNLNEVKKANAINQGILEALKQIKCCHNSCNC